MRRLLFPVLAAGLVAVGHVSLTRPTTAAPPLSADDAARLRAVIRPIDGEEAFDTIPWEISLWEARKKAAAEGKPIFVWSAAADPVGCT